MKDWWLQLGITFICGVGHVAAIIGIGVVSALIVGRVARGQEFTALLYGLFTLIPLSAGVHYLESWLAHDLAYRLLAELRVRVYQLLETCGDVLAVRWPEGEVLFRRLDQTLSGIKGAKSQLAQLRSLTAIIYPALTPTAQTVG